MISDEMKIRILVVTCILLIISIAKLNYDNQRLENDSETRIEDLENELELNNQHLREASEQLAEYEQRGGVEQSYNPNVPDAVIRFPIHDEDFLRYTSPFGLRESPFIGVTVQHTGVDIATVWKAQIVAVADGEVVEHWPPPGIYGGTEFRGHDNYGGMILIDHGDYETLYAHLDESRVVTGQQVSEGDIIGRVGNTGRTTGSHLHFEMFVQGERVNPLLYMQEIESR